MARFDKTEENEKLITSADIENLESLFDLAIKGAGSNRIDLARLLNYEPQLKLKMHMTLKMIKAKQK